MLKLWSIRDSPDRYDNKRNLAVTIMRNKVSDQWRHRQLECGKPATESRTADTARMIEQRDEAELIRQIVGHLPELQQQIFRMKEIEGYDSSEIMQVTGCSAESLRQNLSRARRKIRDDYVRLTARRIGNDGGESRGGACQPA